VNRVSQQFKIWRPCEMCSLCSRAFN